MNILILNWRDPKHPNAGGAEKVTLEHAKGWIAKGHKVTWFSSYFKGAKSKEVIGGVEVIRNGGCMGGVHLFAFFWYLFGKHEKYDLVIDQFHGIPFFTPLYVRVKKLAFIHEVARDVWWFNELKWPFNRVVGFLGYYIEPWIFRLFYKSVVFMTVSKSTKIDLVAYGISAKNIRVIYNGFDSGDIPKNIPPKEKKKTAIFLGAISYDKGIFDALYTFSKINQIESNWQFWIVGKSSPEMENYLHERINLLGIAKNTTYFGYVSDKKKFDLLARAHVMINPSIHEGWGLVNIEAASVGTPVVAYDVSGCRDSVIHDRSGILVKFQKKDDMYKKVLSLVNSENYQKMVEFSLLLCKKFSWQDAIDKSNKLILSI